MNPAPVEWLQRIRKVTQEHGILLIPDEVQAGFARTGKFFASNTRALSQTSS